MSGRFFQEYKGFIWEFDSLSDYLKTVFWRLIGRILGFIIIILLIFVCHFIFC